MSEVKLTKEELAAQKKTRKAEKLAAKQAKNREKYLKYKTKQEEKKASGKVGILTEFKNFISRGSVVDMAVGVIIASSFTAIVNALVQKIFMPLITFTLPGGIDGLVTILKPAVLDEAGNVVTAANQIEWGFFLNTIITFLLVAVILFIILKVITTVKKIAKTTAEEIEKGSLKAAGIEETVEEEVVEEPVEEVKEVTNADILVVLSEIRDSLKENKE